MTSEHLRAGQAAVGSLQTSNPAISIEFASPDPRPAPKVRSGCKADHCRSGGFLNVYLLLRGRRDPFLSLFGLRSVQRLLMAFWTQDSLFAFDVLIDLVSQFDRCSPLVAAPAFPIPCSNVHSILLKRDRTRHQRKPYAGFHSRAARLLEKHREQSCGPEFRRPDVGRPVVSRQRCLDCLLSGWSRQCTRAAADGGSTPREMLPVQPTPLPHPCVISPPNRRINFPNGPNFRLRYQANSGTSIMDMTQAGTCGRVSRAWPTQ